MHLRKLRRAGEVVALAIAVVAFTSGDALALPCPPVIGTYDRADDAAVVADAMALSGPAVGGRLVAPARFYVVRYLKGFGPRVVDVETSTSPIEFTLAPPSAGVGFVPGAGQLWRIFTQTPPGAGMALGVDDVSECVSHPLPWRRRLARVARVGRATPAARWRAELHRDSRTLWCIRMRGRGGGSPARTCRRLRRPGAAVMAVERGRRRGRPSTAVAVAAEGLRAVEVQGGGRSARGSVRVGHLGLAVLPGELSEDELVVDLRLRGGRTVRLNRRSLRTVRVPDSRGGRWHVRAVPIPQTLVRGSAMTCAALMHNTRRVPSGVCRRRREHAFAFRVVERRSQTLVLGLRGRSVAAVTIADGVTTTTPSVAERGGAFLAALPDAISHRDLTITFDFKDGSREIFVGREQANAARPH